MFGFKKCHSTGHRVSILKKTVDYLCHGSYAFAHFVDFSKAFDRVKLLDSGQCLI